MSAISVKKKGFSSGAKLPPRWRTSSRNRLERRSAVRRIAVNIAKLTELRNPWLCWLGDGYRSGGVTSLGILKVDLNQRSCHGQGGYGDDKGQKSPIRGIFAVIRALKIGHRDTSFRGAAVRL
jgi:hypothetical protein